MAELVTDILDAFVADYGSLPWSPGVEVDCCLALAGWAMRLGHDDPAARLRGTYASDEGFRLLVGNAGGVVPLVVSCLPPSARSIPAPGRGDIGVIGSPANIHRQFGALHDGRGWLVRQRQGFGRMSARTLAAWTLHAKLDGIPDAWS